MPGQGETPRRKGRAGDIEILRLLVHDYRRVRARIDALPPQADMALRTTALAQLRRAAIIIAGMKRDLGVTRVRPLPPEPPPLEDAPLPPLPALWPPDGALVGHWAEPDSRILRERPVHLLEDREKLIAEREALLADRAMRRELWRKRQARRGRRRGKRWGDP